MNFKVLKIAVAKQFDRMQKHQLYRTAVSKDAMWDGYLGSFPAGTNEVYRERHSHDCNCCKQFIRAVGDTVAVIDGKLESIWDIKVPSEPGYQVVADALSALVKAQPLENLFLHHEKTAGTDKNFEQIVADGVPKQKAWEHFFVNIDAKYVKRGADIASALADPRTTHDVLARSLKELDISDIDLVLDLIAQKSLYRGDEHKFVLTEFKNLKKEYAKLELRQASAAERDMFVWANINIPGSVSRIRNTSIGTLLVDLAAGKDLDTSVASFEAKVAPTNYKRPTALITQGMIEQAKKTLGELGLTSALERRYATIDDITINNILFANRNTRKLLTGDIFDDLAAETSARVKVSDKIEEVPIERFLADVLPNAESIEVLFENRHDSNLVSLIAPVDPTAGNMFKWDNKFSWSYAGELADSIKERVKKAGGNVSGDLCCRLAWFNKDDLDFHMKEPSGHEIYYGSKRSSHTGGALDVDMNVSNPISNAVENIVYSDRGKMTEGVYQLVVHNFTKRETKNVGFEVEIDYLGDVLKFGYSQALGSSEKVVVAKFKYTRAAGFKIIESLPSSNVLRTTWNIPSGTFHKVNVLMMSPNHWDEKAVGNKHYFFMLEGAKNDGTARGFFNEFLTEDLNKHRKVFEVVGSKTTVPDSDEQLSGLGFSSTQTNTLVCRVKGSFTRTIKIVF